jgi:ATP-dependent protease ClpP protease subunit
MATKNKSELVLAREGKVGKISIIGDIGWDYFGVSYKTFKEDLAKLNDSNIIEVDITSPGGVVTDGIAIMNALVEHPASIHMYVNGMAASIASNIVMGGDRIFIPTNSRMMVHKPLTALWGNADDLDKAKTMLDSAETAMVAAYQRHFKGSDEDIRALMTAETFLSAQEVEDKFNNVTVMEQTVAVAAWDKPHSELGSLADFMPDGIDSLASKTPVSGERVQGDHTKEVDMTPEEKAAMEAEIIAKTTSAVVEALDKRDAEAKVKADEAAEATRLEEEAAAKVIADEVAFEGDLEKPEDVQAHLKKVQLAQLKASADLNTPEGVIAYQEALAKIQGTETPAKGPGSNASADTTTLGSTSGEEYSTEDVSAVVTRMRS